MGASLKTHETQTGAGYLGTITARQSDRRTRSAVQDLGVSGEAHSAHRIFERNLCRMRIFIGSS
jgi:hypothetical protein